MNEVIERKTCRVCAWEHLNFVYDFGTQYVNGFLDAPEQEWPKAPVQIVECPNCTLLQLKHTAPMDVMYQKQYWYKSGINPVISNDLKEIAEQALHYMTPGNVILDIGANDGTLLSFIPDDFHRIGCEPADNLQEELKKNCDAVIHGFWNAKAFSSVSSRKAKVITAIGMFYDADDPVQFLSDAKDCLADDGVLIAQLMTLEPMLKNNDLGNICHEHLSFFSYESLKRLFSMAGLVIYKVEKNGINGGSYRIFARHENGYEHFDLKEEKPDYLEFTRQLQVNKKHTLDFLKAEKRNGKNIYWYGASTKSNTILQWYGLDSDTIVAAADVNTAKHGKYMVGSGIKIIPEEEALDHADILVVGPYGFRDFFLEKLKPWRERGGIVVFTAPYFETI